MIRLYSIPWFRSILSSTVRVQEHKTFIFIVGCYNSGTTLLNHLLSQHNEISGLPSEGVALTSQIPKPEDIGWNRMWHMCRDKLEITKMIRKPDLKKLKKNWCFWFDNSKDFFLEKSIINSLNIDWLEDNFNHPYFIWIVRNGYAAAEGIHRRTLGPGKHPSSYSGGYPLEMCARQWVVNNQVIEEKIKECRNHFLIYYEDLVNSPEDTVGKIFKWLPVEESRLNFDRSFTFHDKTSNIQNMNKENISRLSSEEISVITNEAKDMLKRHNYELLGERP